jgi:hypothetical protein
MPCCGQKRAQQLKTPSAFVHQLAAPRTPAGRFPMGKAYFEYTGQTAITAVGNVTGGQYRFATPGVPVVVDARDRWSLARVPLLREVF